MRFDDDRERLRHVRPQLELPAAVLEAVALVGVVVLLALGVLFGVLAGHEAGHGTVTVTSTR